MTIKATTEQLIKWVGLAIFAQFALTSVHHVYGGLIYEGSSRLSMPILFGIEMLITLGLLFWYRRTRSGVALALFSLVTALAYIVQGLLHSLYSHTYKDILFLAGVPAATVQEVFRPPMAGEFVYPPTDLFFEITGVVELITIYLIALFTYGLIRDRQRGYPSLAFPVIPIVVATLGFAALIVGGSLLMAYLVTDRVSVLILSLLMSGLGALVITVTIAVYRRRIGSPPPLTAANRSSDSVNVAQG